MKRVIFIKEGNYNPNLFADFCEFINNDFEQPQHSLQRLDELAKPTDINLGFFNKADNTFRLVRNNQSSAMADCVAISHYANNMFQPNTNPSFFSPLDFDALCSYADTYGELVYGVPLANDASDNDALVKAITIVKDRTSNTFINAATKEELTSNHPSFIPTVAFFGFAKLKNLPVYYLITDSRLLKIGGGLDVSNDNFEVRLITDHDGNIKDNIITPKFSSNVVSLPNNAIYVKGSSFTLDLFDSPINLLKCSHVDTSAIMANVQSNLWVNSLSGGHITATFDDNTTVGYLKVNIPAGLFLDVVTTTESLEYCYSVFKIA